MSDENTGSSKVDELLAANESLRKKLATFKDKGYSENICAPGEHEWVLKKHPHQTEESFPLWRAITVKPKSRNRFGGAWRHRGGRKGRFCSNVDSTYIHIIWQCRKCGVLTSRNYTLDEAYDPERHYAKHKDSNVNGATRDPWAGFGLRPDEEE